MAPDDEEGGEVWEVFAALEADELFVEGPARVPAKHTAKRRGWLPDFHDQVDHLSPPCVLVLRKAYWFCC